MILVNIPNAEPIVLTEWTYADQEGYQASQNWYPMAKTNCNGLAFSAETVKPDVRARWSDGRISLRCTDGYTYQFRYCYQPAADPMWTGRPNVDYDGQDDWQD